MAQQKFDFTKFEQLSARSICDVIGNKDELSNQANLQFMIDNHLPTEMVMLDSKHNVLWQGVFSSYNPFPGQYAGHRSKFRNFDIRAQIKRIDSAYPDSISEIHVTGDHSEYNRITDICNRIGLDNVNVLLSPKTADIERTAYSIQIANQEVNELKNAFHRKLSVEP